MTTSITPGVTPAPDRFDVVIVGSGAAGLSCALELVQHGTVAVAVICKSRLEEGSTRYAQGGIAAVLEQTDSVESHVADTLTAGAGLCREAVVRMTANRSRQCVERLIDMGVAFTPSDGDDTYPYHLNREGGHSHRRIIHAADSTGQAVATTLAGCAREHPAITLLEHYMAVDIIHDPAGSGRCSGLYALDCRTERIRPFAAGAVVLATGGANKVYLYSSNPHAASGDGIAMAWRAGASLANMEFMQFHPTCLYHADAKNFLISEALRGEGAVLTDQNSRRFMIDAHPDAELAPRDVVARAIDDQMKRSGAEHVWLDIRHKGRAFIEHHFPTITARCRELGLDPCQAPLPVVPAAHYTCGGVVTDTAGRTDVPGLYAIGETACTGLHGANRMASNSLLECLVFAGSCAEAIRSDPPAVYRALPAWDASRVKEARERVVVRHDWSEIRRLMWDYVGIVRSNDRLNRARRRLAILESEIAEHYAHYRLTPDSIELRNLVQVASLIVRCATARRESRGLHYTIDYPDPAAIATDTVIRPGSRGAESGMA